MKSKVVLIGMPVINWNSYLTICKEILNRSITKGLDDRRLDVKCAAGFIATLGELESPGSDPRLSLKNSTLTSHFSFTFLIATDKLTLDEILQRAAKVLSVTKENEIILSVISGNMQEWLFATLACCTGNESYELRSIFGKVILMFEQMGLGRLFDKYKKHSLQDQTFKMLEKT